MKLKIEINMDNDAMLKDPMGEVVRMIKLAVRQTELKDSCELKDINGNVVGKLTVSSYGQGDFLLNETYTIFAKVNGIPERIVNAEIKMITDGNIVAETDKYKYSLPYHDIIKAEIMCL